MTILIFTEGTILMHQSDIGLNREDIVQKVMNKEKTVRDFAHYVPIGNAVDKIKKWADQGGEIIYMTSRKTQKEVDDIQNVLNYNNFPKGLLEYRKNGEQYKDVAERAIPDILIEDDCESIGGEIEMTYPHIRSDLKTRIKSIVVKEFSGYLSHYWSLYQWSDSSSSQHFTKYIKKTIPPDSPSRHRIKTLLGFLLFLTYPVPNVPLRDYLASR